MSNFLENRGVDRSREVKEFEFKPTDVLITFGRGIEKVDMVSGGAQVWKGSRLVQELVVDSVIGRGVRTGKRKVGKPLADFGENDELKEMAAGANANILAAVQFFELAAKNNELPKRVIFSGGRPGYLEKEDPLISEALVMGKEFKRRIAVDGGLGIPTVEVLTESKNTADDLRGSLLKVLEMGYSSATVINVSWAMERTKAFYEHEILPKNPELRGIKVNFITSDELLISRYGKRAEKILNDLKATKAYKDTLINEEIGRNKILKGEYGIDGRKSGGY